MGFFLSVCGEPKTEISGQFVMFLSLICGIAVGVGAEFAAADFVEIIRLRWKSMKHSSSRE